MPSRRLVFLSCILALLAVAGVVPASAASVDAPREPWGGSAKFVPGEVLVRYLPVVSAAGRASARAAVSGTLKRRMLVPRMEVVTLPEGASVASAVRTLEAQPGVEFAEPNLILRAMETVPNDDSFGQLWGMRNTGQTVNGSAGTVDVDIDASDAWDTTQGSTNVVVAVADTGVDFNHPDFSGRAWTNPGEVANDGEDNDGNGKIDDANGWDFIDGDGDVTDLAIDSYHGTHVAGTIAATGNDSYGVAGVDWNAKIMGIRVLDHYGSGSLSGIADGFVYAAQEGAHVLNASLGGEGTSATLQAAVADNPQTLFVVAAGNGGSDGVGDNIDVTPNTPCNVTASNLICVAAINSNAGLASFSNYSDTHVDVGAPGVSVYSAMPPAEVMFSDGFEADNLNTIWTEQNGTLWDRSTMDPLSGSWSLMDSWSGNYNNDLNTSIRNTNAINLTGKNGCVLSYLISVDVEEDFDHVWVEVSTNGTTWTPVNVFTGTGTGFVYDNVEMLDNIGTAFFRFRLETDGSTTADGVQLDDVVLTCQGSTYDEMDFQFLQGTSMATPHVAGAAALIFGHVYGTELAASNVGIAASATSDQVQDVRTRLLETGDATASLSGKTVTGKRVNVDAALAGIAGVSIELTDGLTRVTEDGTTDTYSVVLDSEPANDVTVTITDGASLNVSAGALTFTAMNWDDPQTVTVSPAVTNNATFDGVRSATITHAVTSADADYNGIAVNDVAVSITDYEDVNAASGTNFTDDNGTIFETSNQWLAAAGITLGCNAEGTKFCPTAQVTRGQMAAFLYRALGLPDDATDYFTDDDGVFEEEIQALRGAGVTLGCNAAGTLYCPSSKVTRGAMAAFLDRALALPDDATDYFTDDEGVFEASIQALRGAGITLGCNAAGTLFCPGGKVTRGQMAAFLHRALAPAD